MTDTTERTALRDRIAAALIARIKQAVVPRLEPWPSGAVGSLFAATEFDLADAVLAVLPEPADRAALKRVREYLQARLDQVAVDPAEVFNLLTGATSLPLSPYYSHEACGFHWHGRDGMDIPMRDGQPVCPRCELRRMADEAQQDETQARGPLVRWYVERHDHDGWVPASSPTRPRELAVLNLIERSAEQHPDREFRLARATTTYTVEPVVLPQPEIVHACPPDGSGLTPCCGRTPFELPRTDRISSETPATCPGAVVSQPGAEG